MQPRRLVKAGQSSHTISLPKEWLDRNKLKRGDVVYLNELNNNIIIAPERRDAAIAPRELTIIVDNKPIEQLQREITSAYINSYSTIVLAGEQLNDKAKDIRKALHDFVALEIAEQTAKRIVAKDLLNVKEISVDKTVNRMDMIVRSMFQDSQKVADGEKKLYETVALRDYDINRLYFLLLRMFKSSLKEPALAESFGLDASDIVSEWQVASALESTADYLKTCCRIFGKLPSETNISSLKKIWSEIEQLYLESMKAYNNKSRETAHEVCQKREHLFELAGGYFSNNRDAIAAELVENFKSIITLVCNIARAVIDSE